MQPTSDRTRELRPLEPKTHTPCPDFSLRAASVIQIFAQLLPGLSVLLLGCLSYYCVVLLLGSQVTYVIWMQVIY